MDDKKKIGRPPKFTDEIVNKLEEVFALDGTIGEACFYAGISRTAYYNWIEENPELVDRFDALRENPVLKARRSVIDGLVDPEFALKYLERKKKGEFSVRQEITGADGNPIIIMPSDI
jgi:hypothetical protein